MRSDSYVLLMVLIHYLHKFTIRNSESNKSKIGSTENLFDKIHTFTASNCSTSRVTITKSLLFNSFILQKKKMEIIGKLMLTMFYKICILYPKSSKRKNVWWLPKLTMIKNLVAWIVFNGCHTWFQIAGIYVVLTVTLQM